VAFDALVEIWGVKYDKAVECLTKDRDARYRWEYWCCWPVARRRGPAWGCTSAEVAEGPIR
jgi:hypothetical protein